MRAELQGPDMNGKVHQAKQESAHRMAAGARSVDWTGVISAVHRQAVQRCQLHFLLQPAC